MANLRRNCGLRIANCGLLFRLILFISILTSLLLAGCNPPPDKITMYGSRTPWHSQTIGHSVEHRPIEMLSAGNGPETILIIATIHGDEYAGTPLLYRLADEISTKPEL